MIWVIVAQLTKSARFLVVHETWSMKKVRRNLREGVINFNGAPLSIMSYRDNRFTSKFWKSLQKNGYEVVFECCLSSANEWSE